MIKTCTPHYVKIVSFIFLTVSAVHSVQSQLAFPTAEGAGAYTTGGRGGIVVKVTNLNASGPGSLRAALLMTVPRTIVFEVSGRIQLTSLLELGIANSNFTVAGQTAPEGGITVSGKPIQMGNNGQACNNGIWRYIRFRNGSYTGVNDVYDHNGFISDGTNGLIFDHCSFSFCDDQAISMNSYSGPLTNITIQRCVFSENATQVIAGYTGAYPRGDMSILNNLFVDTSQRTPNMSGSLQWDLINNVYFNWENRLCNANGGAPRINNIGNYYKLGSYSSSIRTNVVQGIVPSIYTANNYHPELFPTPQLDDRALWTNFSVVGLALPNSNFTSTRHQLLGFAPNIKSASETYTSVTNDVGANKYLNADGSFGIYQDSFDILKISNVLNNISSNPYNKSWTQPNLPNNSRGSGWDTDNDGMPNVWENLNGLNPNDANDRNIVQPDGYTNLEYYLNGMTLQTTGITANAGQDVSICESGSTTLTATGGSSYLWSTGATTASITVS
ncbi:hypothetical protein M0G43_10615, partial [Subsaxibacter sp. CAU 1640]|nr:hypothetical protein [Subsaxibacter sp. CAU 1640]